MRINVIHRLIDLKDEELHGLRLDLERLNELVKESENELKTALGKHDELMGEIRETESQHRMASAHDMIAHRNFLTHLHEQSEQARQMLFEVTTQRNLAQEAMELAYTEKKSYELIAERKLQIMRQKQNRQQFQVADEVELLRSQRMKGFGS